MKAFAPFFISACALALYGCGGPAEEADAPADETVETPAAADAPAPEQEVGRDNEVLNAAARAACERGREGFLEEIPDGAAFVYRGPDAVMRLACTLDGERESWLIPVTALDQDARAPLDFAVANVLRHNASRGDDRETSGFFSARDGGLCAIQLDEEVTRPMCEEARRAAVLVEAADAQP